MDIETVRDYCLSLPHVTENFPFGDLSLAFKISGKMFALLPLDNPEHGISLKCDPIYAIELREAYAEILPAFHFNKKYWNSVSLTGSLSRKLVHSLIDHSYREVVAKLPKATRLILQNDEKYPFLS